MCEKISSTNCHCLRRNHFSFLSFRSMQLPRRANDAKINISKLSFNVSLRVFVSFLWYVIYSLETICCVILCCFLLVVIASFFDLFTALSGLVCNWHCERNMRSMDSYQFNSSCSFTSVLRQCNVIILLVQLSDCILKCNEKSEEINLNCECLMSSLINRIQNETNKRKRDSVKLKWLFHAVFFQWKKTIFSFPSFWLFATLNVVKPLSMRHN